MKLAVNELTILPSFSRFPRSHGLSLKHRDLVVDKNGHLYLVYDDYPHGSQKVRGYLHLQEGKCYRTQPKGAVYSCWQMGIVEHGEMKRVIVSY